MSAGPVVSYGSTPAATPPRTAPQSSEPSNSFSTPYSPRYFENPPNGSVHRPSSRTSSPTRFSSISPRKLPPAPTFPDLRAVSPLNPSVLDQDVSISTAFRIEADLSDTDDDS